MNSTMETLRRASAIELACQLASWKGWPSARISSGSSLTTMAPPAEEPATTGARRWCAARGRTRNSRRQRGCSASEHLADDVTDPDCDHTGDYGKRDVRARLGPTAGLD